MIVWIKDKIQEFVERRKIQKDIKKQRKTAEHIYK